MDPKITVAIPIYNAEKYLDYAIRSTLNQTFTDFELLLINDGSTDSSLEIMSLYKDDPRVKIIDDGENKGLIYRLNQSIDLAKGKYYARMDADDIMFPDRLEKQYSCLESNPYIDVLGGSSLSIDSDNNIVGYRPSSNDNWTSKQLSKGSRFTHPSVMGKLSWFRNNLYSSDWNRAEDYELWLRSVGYSKFFNLDEPLIFYREVGIPSFSKYNASQKTIRKIIKEYKRFGLTFTNALLVYVLSVLKSSIYFLFSMINKVDFLICRRSSVIEDKTVYASKMIHAIK